MDPALLTTNTLVPLLMSAGLLLAASIPSLLVYGYLADRVQFAGIGKVSRDWFGGWDALVAVGIVLFFGLIIVLGATTGSSSSADAPQNGLPSTKLIVFAAVQTEVLFLTIVAGIIAVLHIGGFSAKRSLGLQDFSILPAFFWAVLLLMLAYPLIGISLQVWRLLIASAGYLDDSQQDAVRFLAESKSMTARLVVSVQAVLFAPLQEELIFRGYLYGVAKRYLGVTASLVLVSALFAGIHNHLPSFAGLFMLAICLNLAYEWTGSILVPMAMHAVFNFLSVLVLFH